MPSPSGQLKSTATLPLPKLELPRSELPFEPRNEAGVAVLFGQLAEKLGFKIIDAQVQVPDLTVTLHGRKIRVELEYSSKGFRREVNDGSWRKCDLVVCWKHDWGSFPPNIAVYELRKVFGIGWNVWVQPMWSEFADRLPRGKQIAESWSVPSMAGPDDLLLIYWPKSDPEMHGNAEIREIMRVRAPVQRVHAGWKQGLDWMSSIQRVVTLADPITLDDLTQLGLRAHSLQGRPNVTVLWPQIHRRLSDADPRLQKALQNHGPDRARA